MFPRILTLSILLTLASSTIALSAGWERTSGPGGGVVTAIAASNSPGVPYILAGTDEAGIFRSESDGDNWTAVNAGLSGPLTWRVTRISVGDNSVLAGTMRGVFRSSDEGLNWIPVDPTGHSLQFFDDFDRAGSLIYAVATEGIFRSSDDGLTWLHVDSNLIYVYPECIVVDPIDSSTVYVGTEGYGVYRSTDSGATWAPRRTGLGDYYINSLVFHDGYLLAGTSSHGVYRSSNGGENWEAWDFGLPNPFDGAIISLAVTSSRVFAGTSGCRVFVQTTGTSSWQACGDTLRSGVNALCIKDSRVFAGTQGGGVYRVEIPDDITSPFPAWTKANTGLTADGTTSLLEVGHSGGNYHYLLASTYFNGLFVSSDSGVTWAQPVPLAELQIYALACKGNIIFAGVWSEGLYRLVGGSSSWELVDSNGYVLEFCVSGSHVIASDQGGNILISTDNGLTWDQTGSGVPAGDHIRDLAVVGDTVYGGTRYHGLYRSTDHGLNWTPVWSPPEVNKAIGSIAISGNDIFVLTVDDVYLSSDAGVNWVTAGNGLSGYEYYLFQSTSGLFAYGPLGVYVTHNRGTNWTRVNEGLEVTDVVCMAEFSGSLYAGVDMNSVWKRRLSEMSYMPGDADGSMMFTISDAVYLINYIFSGGAAPNPVLAGDADCSAMVTISDAVYLINYIFSGGPQPGAVCK